jgi:hypothetical protein
MNDTPPDESFCGEPPEAGKDQRILTLEHLLREKTIEAQTNRRAHDYACQRIVELEDQRDTLKAAASAAVAAGEGFRDELAKALRDLAASQAEATEWRARANAETGHVAEVVAELRAWVKSSGGPSLAEAVAAEREACAQAVERHMIYTGPGGVDPEPYQRILARALRQGLRPSHVWEARGRGEPNSCLHCDASKDEHKASLADGLAAIRARGAQPSGGVAAKPAGHETCPDNPCPGHHPYCEGVGKHRDPPASVTLPAAVVEQVRFIIAWCAERECAHVDERLDGRDCAGLGLGLLPCLNCRARAALAALPKETP